MAQPDPSTANLDTNPTLNVSCLDFLLIELVPLSFRTELSRYLDENPYKTPGKRKYTELSKEEQDNLLTTTLGIGSIGGGAPLIDPEDLRLKVQSRLHAQGHRVGALLAARYTRDAPRLGDDLEKMKFVCKDLWLALFNKHVDNLKTNHRGVFVLTDNAFRGLKNASLEKGRDAAGMMGQAQAFLWFFEGVVQGALRALGLESVVQAECGELPGVTFHIRSVG